MYAGCGKIDVAKKFWSSPNHSTIISSSLWESNLSYSKLGSQAVWCAPFTLLFGMLFSKPRSGTEYGNDFRQHFSSRRSSKQTWMKYLFSNIKTYTCTWKINKEFIKEIKLTKRSNVHLLISQRQPWKFSQAIHRTDLCCLLFLCTKSSSPSHKFKKLIYKNDRCWD